MNAFAGFWVDGAVRTPEEKHRDCNGWIVAKWKGTGINLDICNSNFSGWRKVYWLDTTPRESLTPEELYSLLKVLMPSLDCVKRSGDGTWYVDNLTQEVKIDWGSATQFPPPKVKTSVKVTQENVKDHIFSKCNAATPNGMYEATVVGWDTALDQCLVSCAGFVKVTTYAEVVIEDS